MPPDILLPKTNIKQAKYNKNRDNKTQAIREFRNEHSKWLRDKAVHSMLNADSKAGYNRDRMINEYEPIDATAIEGKRKQRRKKAGALIKGTRRISFASRPPLYGPNSAYLLYQQYNGFTNPVLINNIPNVSQGIAWRLKEKILQQ